MYLFTANIWSNAYAAWFKFMKDEFNIKCEIGVTLDSWNDLYLNSGVYSAIFSELVCVVTKYPKKIHVDELKRLHNVSGPACQWGHSTEETKFDGYYIHGRKIEQKLFDSCVEGKITGKDFLRFQNEEDRAAAYEILGEEKVMALLNAKEIDRGMFAHANGEMEEIILYKTKETFTELDNEPLAWVRFTCPSTGTNYLIAVPPKYKTAKEAALSTSPLFNSLEEYSFTDRA